jgi:hypothetical protein
VISDPIVAGVAGCSSEFKRGELMLADGVQDLSRASSVGSRDSYTQPHDMIHSSNNVRPQSFAEHHSGHCWGLS